MGIWAKNRGEKGAEESIDISAKGKPAKFSDNDKPAIPVLTRKKNPHEKMDDLNPVTESQLPKLIGSTRPD